MANIILEKLRQLELRAKSPSSSAFNELMEWMPSDYKQFMTLYDGGVGFINNKYVDLWPQSTIFELHPYFDWLSLSDQLIVIGSNGSGTLYGYGVSMKIFFEVDEYMTNEDEIIDCGSTFADFISYLSCKSHD